MISEGAEAPAVSLPAYVDGERRRVDLGEYVGEGIVVLAFYPADFNPACTMQAADIGDLDLFTMQKDVSVFGVSPDSTYSHEAFAERYGLHVPLLSDADGEAADAYDVTVETETGEPLVERAVFVVDHRGVVQYAWSTDDLETGIDVGPVRDAVGAIGGDDTAVERYRVGHDDYAEGREAFEAAMADYEDREWMDARGGFEAAEPAFASAADHLDTAVRFAETEDFERVVDRAQEKADTLAHAASWLADSANELASGRGKQGREYRADAQRLLDAATELADPPEPDAFDLTADGVALDDSVVIDPEEEVEVGYEWRADDPASDTDLGVDDDELDAAVDADAPADDTESDPGAAVGGDAVDGDLQLDVEAMADDESGDEADDTDDADGSDESSIEGDTVEGDLEMDFEAIDDESDGTDGEADAERDTEADAEGDASTESTAGQPGAGSAAAGGGPAGSGGGATAASGASRAADTDGSTGATDDAKDGAADEVEELELADPTADGDEEADSEDDDADWDIPGQ